VLAAGDDLEAAWADFGRAQQQTVQMLRQSEFFGNDQERAEAYRGVLYSIVGSFKTALMDPDQPRFMRAVDWSSSSWSGSRACAARARVRTSAC
jgi:hypothetical protein